MCAILSYKDFVLEISQSWVNVELWARPIDLAFLADSLASSPKTSLGTMFIKLLSHSFKGLLNSSNAASRLSLLDWNFNSKASVYSWWYWMLFSSSSELLDNSDSISEIWRPLVAHSYSALSLSRIPIAPPSAFINLLFCSCAWFVPMFENNHPIFWTVKRPLQNLWNMFLWFWICFKSCTEAGSHLV